VLRTKKMSVVSPESAWSRSLIALSRSTNIESETRRTLKRVLFAHAADMTAALVLLLQRADVDDFVHTTNRLLSRKSTSSSSNIVVDLNESVWRAFATNLIGTTANLSTTTTTTSNNSMANDHIRADAEMQREREMRALAAFDVHALNKLHLRDDSERRFDVRSHINPVFLSDESIPVPPPLPPIVATPVPELRLDSFIRTPAAIAASAAPRPSSAAAVSGAAALEQFAQPTAFALSTFSHNDVERLAAERRAQLAAAIVDAEHAGTVVSTVAMPNDAGAVTRSELAGAVSFLESVQTALAAAPQEVERFFHVLEEYQRNRSATVDDTVRQLHALLLANKQPALAAQLTTFLPAKPTANASGLLAQRLADATAVEFRIATAQQPPSSWQQQQIQQQPQQQPQQPQPQFQPQYQQYQQQQQQQQLPQQLPQQFLQTLLPTAPTTFNIYQQSVVQQQQDMMFVAPTVTSGLLGGLPDSADAAAERIARLRALKALREARTVRESAALLVRAAARFVRGGVDKKFLEIMRSFAGGALDRAEVVTRVRELFAESNDVERGEGQQMVDAFLSIRARAQLEAQQQQQQQQHQHQQQQETVAI
jgi:hypothetical protein